jgi:hypothetical protein
MRASFYSRFLWFTLAFYAGCVATVFFLTIVRTGIFFQVHFWTWLWAWIKGDVFPVALAELFRSPLMGLLFSFLGPSKHDRSWILKFGLACGAFSYAIADFFSVIGSSRGSHAEFVTNHNLIEYSLLGLPIAFVLLSRVINVQDT